jgi:hypothetical protein
VQQRFMIEAGKDRNRWRWFESDAIELDGENATERAQVPQDSGGLG